MPGPYELKDYGTQPVTSVVDVLADEAFTAEIALAPGEGDRLASGTMILTLGTADGWEQIEAESRTGDTLNNVTRGVGDTDPQAWPADTPLTSGFGAVMFENLVQAQDLASYATDTEVTTAVTNHSAASDPHGDRAFATSADATVASNAASALSTHVGATDPHADRAYTDAQIDAITAGSIGALPANDPSVTNARTPTSHAASHAAAGSDPITPANIGAIPATEKAAANGVATLGADSLIPTSQIPALAIGDVFEVASQAAMLALTAQVGDLAIRTDQSKTYILGASPASVLANWILLQTPTDAVTSVNSQVGVVVLVKGDVGLGNVDNTSDVNKPVSTAQATADAAVASAAASALATHTGNTSNPHGVTKAQVGLGSVDNTADSAKPVSSAQQTAIDGKVADAIADTVTTIAPSQNAVFDALALKLPTSYLDTDATFAANSDSKIPSQKAVKAGITANKTVDCRAATAASLPAHTTTLSGTLMTANANGALATQDGVTMLVGDKLFNQHSPLGDVGAWVIESLGSAGTPWVMRRVPGFDTWAGIVGSRIMVTEGTQANYRGQIAYNTNALGGTLGSTTITYQRLTDAHIRSFNPISGQSAPSSTNLLLTNGDTRFAAAKNMVDFRITSQVDIAGTTLTKLDQLEIPSPITAARRYKFYCWLQWTSDLTTSGIEFGFANPASPDNYLAKVEINNGIEIIDAVPELGYGGAANDLATVLATECFGNSSNQHHSVRAWGEFDGANFQTGDTFYPRCAATDSGATLSVVAGGLELRSK